MPSSCFSCVFAIKGADGSQTGCDKDYIKLIPPEYLGEETHEDKVFTVSMLACPMQVTPAQKEVLGDKLEEYLEKKNTLYIDYFVFLPESEDWKRNFKKTLASILKQQPAPRKIAVVSMDHSKGMEAVKGIPGSVYWSLHIPGEPLKSYDEFMYASYFYEVSNESVKIQKNQTPPRPHNLTYCEAGFEYPDSYASTLQDMSLTFKPFLAVRPQPGSFNGFTLNRKFYSMINSNKGEPALLKLDKLPEAYPDQKVEMLYSYETLFNQEAALASP